MSTNGRRCWTAAGVLFLALWQGAPADAVIIDFDGSAAPCLFVDTVAVRTEFSGLGVTFLAPGNDGGAIVDECGNFAVVGHSSPNFLGFNSIALLSDGGVPRTPQTILFDPPYPLVVSFKAGSGIEASTLTAEAFDSGDSSVNSQTVVLGAGMRGVVLSSPAGIAKVVVTDPGPFVIDDLEFSDVSPCGVAPEMGCKTAGKSLLLLKNDVANDAKDKLIFKWLRGAETTLDELGIPTATTSYSLCLYAGSSSALIDIPPGSSWQAVGSKGFKYSDPSGSPKALVKAGADGKAKALVKGKGINLPDSLVPMLPLPVTAQLRNDEDVCFGAVFEAGDVIKNDAKQFKAKN